MILIYSSYTYVCMYVLIKYNLMSSISSWLDFVLRCSFVTIIMSTREIHLTWDTTLLFQKLFTFLNIFFMI